MKKLFAIVMMFLFSFFLVSCDNEITVNSGETAVSKDYGKVIELAKTEFKNIFEEYENVQIEDTSTMARTDGEETVIVQIDIRRCREMEFMDSSIHLRIMQIQN